MESICALQADRLCSHELSRYSCVFLCVIFTMNNNSILIWLWHTDRRLTESGETELTRSVRVQNIYMLKYQPANTFMHFLYMSFRQAFTEIVLGCWMIKPLSWRCYPVTIQSPKQKHLNSNDLSIMVLEIVQKY